MPYTKKEVQFFADHLNTKTGGVEDFIKHCALWGQQNIHTPFPLCRDIVEKLRECITLDGKEIAVLFNVEFLHVLLRNFGLRNQNVTMFVDDEREFKFCEYEYRLTPGVNLFYIDMMKTLEEGCLHTTKGQVMKKFDVTVGNPPYQAPKEKKHEGRGKSGASLWDKFVEQSTKITKENGFICLVHPAAWRKPDNHLNALMRNKDILYLEIHDHQDGVKTFGCQTRYDWYVMQNCPSKSKTIIKGQDGVVTELDLTKSPVIPNAMIDEIMSLIAKPGEERIEIIYSRSAYGSDKPHMSKEQKGEFKHPSLVAKPGEERIEIIYSSSAYETRKPHMSKEQKGEFKHPCLYSINVKGQPTFWYSSTTDNGHFGVPKVCFPSGHYGSVDILVDERGDYGLTQFGRGVVDDPKNLPKIAAAMRSERFKQMAMAFATSTTELDKIVFSYFRKDFWKEFV